MLFLSILFILRGAGIFLAAEPFVKYLEEPAGVGVDTAIANILGSEILNNSLLLGIMVLAATMSNGLEMTIPSGVLLSLQAYWASVLTLLATPLFVDKLLKRREGVLLMAFYAITTILQFYVPSLIIASPGVG